MKILVTGAAGFIGSQLAYRLYKEDCDLVLIDNFSYGKLDNLVFDDHDFSKEIITMDIRDRSGIAEIMGAGDIDYVYNIAGIAPLPDCQADPVEAVDVNVNGLINILENSRKYGVKKVIQASTNAIYENTSIFPTPEEWGSGYPTLIYPNTKFCAERFAQSYWETYGLSSTCLRFANVYGPHIDCLRKQPPFVAYMIRELYYGRVPVFHSNGQQKRDYIYVDDLIDLALAVRFNSGYDCVNVAGNASYSVNEMYELAKEIMGVNIDASYADSQHYWEKYPELFSGVYKIKEEVLSHEINKFTLCSNEYAKSQYNWVPKVGIREGLTRVIAATCQFLKNRDEAMRGTICTK